jgi:hypothetical protein
VIYVAVQFVLSWVGSEPARPLQNFKLVVYINNDAILHARLFILSSDAFFGTRLQRVILEYSFIAVAYSLIEACNTTAYARCSNGGGCGGFRESETDEPSLGRKVLFERR